MCIITNINKTRVRLYAYVRENEQKENKNTRKEDREKIRVTERMRPARMRYIIAYTYIHIRFYVLSNSRGSEKNELNIGYPFRK